jgi:hypothetical protein
MFLYVAFYVCVCVCSCVCVGKWISSRCSIWLLLLLLLDVFWGSLGPPSEGLFHHHHLLLPSWFAFVLLCCCVVSLLLIGELILSLSRSHVLYDVVVMKPAMDLIVNIVHSNEKLVEKHLSRQFLARLVQIILFDHETTAPFYMLRIFKEMLAPSGQPLRKVQQAVLSLVAKHKAYVRHAICFGAPESNVSLCQFISLITYKEFPDGEMFFQRLLPVSRVLDVIGSFELSEGVRASYLHLLQEVFMDAFSRSLNMRAFDVDLKFEVALRSVVANVDILREPEHLSQLLNDPREELTRHFFLDTYFPFLER